MPCSHLGAHTVICLPWKNCGPRRDRLDRVAQCHRYPNRGLRRWRQPKEELRMLGPELVHAPALGIYTQQFQREAPEKGSPTYLSCHHLASTQASRSWGQSHPRTCRRVTVLSPRTEALCSPLLLQSTPAPSWRDDGISYRAPALSCLVPSKSPAAAPSCSRQLTLLLRSSCHH